MALDAKIEAQRGDAVWACRLPARVSKEERAKIIASVSLENREAFFAASVQPITSAAEQRMEQMSLEITREHYGNDFWQSGRYACARCQRLLYTSTAKFAGPCIWPSFRTGASPGALTERHVTDYNNYTCATCELYCGGCGLFVGHGFEDGAAHGDTHPDAAWRHCVLSMSFEFQPDGASIEQGPAAHEA